MDLKKQNVIKMQGKFSGKTKIFDDCYRSSL